MIKSQKYLELVEDLKKLANEPVVLIDEAAVDGEVVQMMRELRQFIERFRRLHEGGDAPVKFLKREDVARLGRDELAFIVDSFWDWYNENECPAERCDDYFCHYCQDVKERADEELADGDMNAEDYNHLAKNGFYDGLCCGSHDGCWPVFFLWCYRNGYDTETGKKKDTKNATL